MRYVCYFTGFLSDPSVGSMKGNFALFDLQAAIQWVHSNIHRFGGDPERVTLMGHSHGAALAHLFANSMLSTGNVLFLVPSPAHKANINTAIRKERCKSIIWNLKKILGRNQPKYIIFIWIERRRQLLKYQDTVSIIEEIDIFAASILVHVCTSKYSPSHF